VRTEGGVGRPLTEVLGSLAVPVQVPSSLLERRPDVREAEDELHAATARIGAAKGNLLPVFTVTGDYGTDSPTSSDLFSSRSEIYQVLVGVSVPLFTGGRLGKQVDVARGRVDARRRGLRLAEMRYQAGASSYLDLLDAQRSLFTVELALAQVQGQQALAAVTLYKALGGEWPTAP
jgi:multidrug efflux system outer membrane protein